MHSSVFKSVNVSKALGICAVFRRHQYAGGAYSFVENLLRGFASLLPKLPAEERFELTCFLGSEGIPWSDPQFTFKQMRDPLGRWPVETRVGFVDSAGLDAVLFPNTFTPPVVRAKRTLTVIHDLQYRNLPEHWPAAKRAWMRACHEVTLRRCDKVIAISQWVKNDILKHYGSRWESRVETIWNPVALDRFIPAADPRFSGGRPYILCTAVDRPAKNLSTLIRAYALFRKRFPEFSLVMVGQLRNQDRTWRRKASSVESKLPSTTELVAHLGLEKDIVLTGFVADEQLGSLYRGASLFVLPSLFEGFGMPAVEALALGAPTLVSDLPVLREVTLDGARYVSNPQDEHEMAQRMAEVIEAGPAARPSPEFSRDLRNRFAPETIARKYLSVMLNQHYTE